MLAAFYFVSFSAMGVFFPFLATWAEARGITGFWLAGVGAVRPVAGILAPPLVGLLADLFGLRRSLLRLSAIGSALAFLALTLAVGRGTVPLPFLLAALFVFALCRAPMSSLTDVAALESGQSYGSLRLWGSLGFLVAAGLIGYVIDLRAELPFPFVITLLLLLTVGMTFALPSTPRLPPRPVWSAARALFGAPDFQLFLVGVFIWHAAHAAYDLLLALHLRDLGASFGFAGLAWALGTLAEVALMLWYRPWLERFGAPRLMVAGAVVGVLRWTLLALVRSPELVLLSQPLHAGSFALVFVGGLEHLRRRAEPQVLATAQGLFTAIGGAGAALALFVWAPLYAASGGSRVFAAAAAVALFSVVAFALVAWSPALRPLAAVETGE